LLDRWLVLRADRVTAADEAEAALYRALGLSPERVARTPPGVAPTAGLGRPPQPGLPDSARAVVCVGRLEPHKGFRDAVWAFDILRHLYDDLHLVVVGEGPEREALERFARTIAATDRVHVVGPQADVYGWLGRADVVWVPARSGGAAVALEAMAAGRPVVAATPLGLAGVVADMVTGCLVAPGDKAALARQTRLLLEDAALRRRLGEAGRRRAHALFAARDAVRRHAELYASVCGRAG
jgi:glycosyltransferase involved in cell wall biosynthesis